MNLNNGPSSPFWRPAISQQSIETDSISTSLRPALVCQMPTGDNHWGCPILIGPAFLERLLLKEEEGTAGSTRLFQITRAPPRSHFWLPAFPAGSSWSRPSLSLHVQVPSLGNFRIFAQSREDFLPCSKDSMRAVEAEALPQSFA